MDNDLLKKALKVVNDKNVLVNLASKRASQLFGNERALVEIPRDSQGNLLEYSNVEIALLEIAEGKISFEKIES